MPQTNRMRTMIYGSGSNHAEEGKSNGNTYGGGYSLEENAAKLDTEQQNGSNERENRMDGQEKEQWNPLLAPFFMLNEIMLKPLQGLNDIMSQGTGIGPRKYSVGGNIVPLMSTKEINKKNIYG